MKTNLKLSKSHKPFLSSCKKANIYPSKRQYSKFRNGKGIAIAVMLGDLPSLTPFNQEYYKEEAK